MTAIVDGTVGVTFPSGHVSNGIVLTAVQPTTSGVNIDFTGIPNTVRRLKLLFQGVSTSGANTLLVQLGAGSIVTSGYLSSGVSQATAANPTIAQFTNAFGVNTGSAANLLHGEFDIDLLTANNYVVKYLLTASNTGNMFYGAGSINLGGVLDRVRLTTTGGTDTFDAGQASLQYE